jgi:NADPH:quinone reductase-like Zn-dependent oxidoreductase
MRAVRFASFGDPADVLTVEDLPVLPPGPGQVLVRMQVRPINPSDLFTIRGTYGTLPRLPATPGYEGAGVIAVLGEGVSGLGVGQLVVPFSAAGTWQEYVVVPADALMPAPPGMDERQAAMLLANPTSAWLLLHEELRVQPGGWLLQNAANSAVGRFVIQLCRRAGVRTINVVRRRELIEELRAEGADEVLCETDGAIVERVRMITGGKGAPYALDSVGGESGAALVQSLAPGGMVIVFGAISGQPLAIDSGAMLFRGTTVRGWWLSRWFRTATPERRAALFSAVVPLILDGTLRAPVAAEFDLGEVRGAVIMAAGSERNGKVVLVG